MNEDVAVYEALAKGVLGRCFVTEDPSEIHQWIQGELNRLEGKVDEQSAMAWEESFDIYDEILLKRADLTAKPEKNRKTLNWGWKSWDEIIDPLEPGLLAVLSAGDGMGKTIYAEMLAEHWAKQRNRVVFIHYELNRSIMLDRRMARHTSIARRILKSGQFNDEQRKRIDDVRPKLLSWDGFITYLHTPGWSMDKVMSELRKLKGDDKCDVVVLDYLEKNAASNRQIKLFGQNAYMREADNVEVCKNFAESTGTPVLMITQMSKAGKSQKFESMDRTDMRGAGEKSEKANIVALLHREHVNDGYSNTVDVRVDKNTVGRTGTFKQYMEPEFFRVADLHRVDLNKYDDE